MADDSFSYRNDSGHRNSVAIEDDDEFGLRQRLKTLKKSHYWVLVVLLAVGLSIYSYGWQNYWLPEKPLAWKAWSKFQAQQTISLKRPLLVLFPAKGGNGQELKAFEQLQGFIDSLETPEFRKAFHRRSGQALVVSPETDDSELLWLFGKRPYSSTLWLIKTEASSDPSAQPLPRLIAWDSTTVDQMTKMVSEQ